MKALVLSLIFVQQALALQQSCAFLAGHETFPELAQPHIIGSGPGEMAYDHKISGQVSARPFWDGSSIMVARSREGNLATQELVVKMPQGKDYSVLSIEPSGFGETLVQVRSGKGETRLIVVRADFKSSTILFPMSETRDGTLSYRYNARRFAVKNSEVWEIGPRDHHTNLSESRDEFTTVRLVKNDQLQKIGIFSMETSNPQNASFFPLNIDVKDLVRVDSDLYTYSFPRSDSSQGPPVQYMVLSLKTATGIRVVAVSSDGNMKTLTSSEPGRRVYVNEVRHDLKIVEESARQFVVYDIINTLSRVHEGWSNSLRSDFTVQNYLDSKWQVDWSPSHFYFRFDNLRAVMRLSYDVTRDSADRLYTVVSPGTSRQYNNANQHTPQLIQTLEQLAKEGKIAGVVVQHTQTVGSHSAVTVGIPSYQRAESRDEVGDVPPGINIGPRVGNGLVQVPGRREVYASKTKIPFYAIQKLWVLGPTPEATARLDALIQSR